jgi:hypothetical protein
VDVDFMNTLLTKKSTLAEIEQKCYNNHAAALFAGSLAAFDCTLTIEYFVTRHIVPVIFRDIILAGDSFVLHKIE